MKPKSSKMTAPISNMPLPPGHKEKIEALQDKEELFSKVEESGFINPTYFEEVLAQGLYSEYQEWKGNGPPKGNPINNITDRIINDD